MRKKINLIYCFLIVLIALVSFFQFMPMIVPDSATYYSYLRIFKGVLPFSSWDVMRGPSFPAFIYLIVKLFGESTSGLLIGLFFPYVLMLVLLFRIISKSFSHSDKYSYGILTYILFTVLVVFNPLIIGYSHSLLTETLAPLFSIICIFLSYNWMKLEFDNSKFKYILYVICYTVIFVFVWFLKQPYLPIMFASMLAASIMSILSNRKIKNILVRSCSLLFCLVVVVFSIKTWDLFLKKNGAVTTGNHSNDSYLSSGLISAINDYVPIDSSVYCNVDFIKNSMYFSVEDKEDLIKLISDDKNNCATFRVYDVYGLHNNIIDRVIYRFDDGGINTINSIGFLVSNFFKHPILYVDSYIKNYLASIDVFESYVENDRLVINRRIPENNYKNNHENASLGFLALREGAPLCWWQYEDFDSLDMEKYGYILDMSMYEKFNNPSKTVLSAYTYSSDFTLFIFKLLFLILPILLIYSLYKVLKTKYDSVFCFLFIMYFSSFVHLIFHSFTGAVLDRYSYVAFPITLVGTIMLISKKKREDGIMLEKNKNKFDKILFVIPAYNEAENIEKVLNEIKKDVKGADILVINDCSKDNTRDIVLKNNVKCISNIFNMKYAMAVQTGIKYAYENDYDMVIQFDADGQHVAKYANDMIKKMKETNCDIVIGSRFLKKTEYKHSFFRMLGTKLFRFIIKLFCNKKITDPTSGFQCLNRRVIERYSKIGNYPEFPDANLIIEMLYDGYNIEEVSVHMRARENGVSMHSGIWKPVKYMVKVLYSIVITIIKNIGKRGRNE
jgi:hypothetical protein